MPDFEYFAHLSIRAPSAERQRGWSDTEMLLRGSPDEISEHIQKSVRSALTSGHTSEIRIVPVPHYQVWDVRHDTG